MVNNVILIGRIEPPLILALSVLLLGERVNNWVIAGALFSFVGVVLTILLQDSGNTDNVGLMIGKGELMAAGEEEQFSSLYPQLLAKLSYVKFP